MKKIVIIFFILIGSYLLLTNLHRIPGIPFGTSEDSVKVTDRIDTIEIDITSIKTNIVPDNRNDVKAQLQGRGDVKVSKTGDTILVEYKKGVFNWPPFGKNSSLTIYVPENYNRDMTFRIGSGHLEITDSPMSLTDLSVTVHSGNVKLHELTVEDFTLEVASGNATIRGLSTAEGEFDIRSGNVNLDKYSGKLDAEVSSGRFKANIEKLTDSITVDVNSGLFDLDLPDDADFTLNTKKSSGFISNDFTLEDVESNGNTLRGTHGKGTHQVDLKVASGKIGIK